MKPIISTLFLSSLLALTGCGSMLATFEADTIYEDQGTRTMGRAIEDDNIETKSRVNIHAADDNFDNAHLNIVSFNGYVLIAGQVQSEALRLKATEVVRKIRGVRRIYNELEISAPSSGITRTSDTWVTTKVKSWLLGSPDTEGLRVKVVTENGVVHLMGLVSRAEAERISTAVSGISGVQRVVRLFELLD